MNLATLRDAFSGVPSALKARITRLNNEKLKFFNNDPTCRYQSGVELEQEELLLFQTMMDTHAKDIKEQISDLQVLIDGPKERQMQLDGTIEDSVAHQFELQAMEWNKQIEALAADLEHVDKARDTLVSAKNVPFVWDIAFVEIFTGEKGGFDIVIGNPPYVRQENIADPKLPREEITTANKRAYKAKLARSVYQAFPRFFGYRRKKDVKRDNPSTAVSHKLDAKSDLYIYFYFHGLSLLNPKGSFCFITSNSWLDVAYGSDLQEFTLKHCHIKQVIDNQSRRSFASADVNTVIGLFSAPDKKRQWGLDQNTRFIMFKTPFEGVLDAVIFEEVEEADERKSTEEHRIFPISQRSLFERGVIDASPKPKYTGDKWGGKYLRAPDIYWTILEKGKGKLVRLGDVAEVRFGIKTGANGFFYLDDAKILEWAIEDEFLKPVIKSPRECKSILIDPSQLKFKLFMCHKDETALNGTAVWKYIEYGESQRYDQRPTCSGRMRWWEIPDEKGNTFWGKEVRERIAAFCSTQPMYADCRLYVANTKPIIQVLLNSTLTAFMSEASARSLGGGGGPRSMMVYEVQELKILSESAFIHHEKAAVNLQYKMENEVLKPLVEDIQENPHRQILDTLIFDALNLTQGECDAVYEAVIHLVETRLQKASSLRG